MSVAQIRPSLRLIFNIHGTSLFLDRENRVVARRSGTGVDCSGYVFTNRPFYIGESLTVRVHSISEASKGVLGFGMTSCDPDSLLVQGLPDDCDLLYDRPEYWVIDKARFVDLHPGDELDFHFIESATGDGEIKYSKNDQKPVSLMFMDKTVPLWAFFDLGNVREMKILESSSSYHLPVAAESVSRTNITTRSVTSDIPRNRSNHPPSFNQSQERSQLQTAQVSPTPSQEQRKGVCSSPRPNPPPIPPRPLIKQPPVFQSSQFAPTPLVLASKNQVSQMVDTLSLKTGALRFDRTAGNQMNREAPSAPTVSQKSGSRDRQKTSSSDNDCAVCMERDIDCVLYTCGHMCLCYECAIGLKTRTNSECPICRKTITDVIKTFKA